MNLADIAVIIWSNYFAHIIDILVVWFIFYRILVLLKGTKAIQIITGILILLVLTFIAKDILHLDTISWLFDKFWLAAVVIIAVVFQPEIRSALAQLGSQKWGKIVLLPELGFINEIIEAVSELSTKKTGALIVIERYIGLKNYVDTGTYINAAVSREIVLSVFHKESPIHDGAIIIRDGRLVAAGCVLPLSNESKISKNYGTRHKAGLGLSEMSDAIVIIVSEETGKIALAVKNKLHSDIDSEDLRRQLMDLYVSGQEKSFLKRFKFK